MRSLSPTKLGALAFVVGALFALVGNLMHPRTASGALGAGAIAEEAALIQGTLGTTWYPSHIALILFPPILFVGYIVLYRTLRDKGERTYSLLGLVLVALAVPLFIISLVLDGFITPLLAREYLASSGSAQELAGALFAYNFLLSLSLLGPAFLMYVLGIGFFGASIVQSKAYSRWLGWAGVAIGVVGAIGYAAGAFGPYWVLTLGFTPLALAFTIWVLATGASLYRSGPPSG